MTLRSTADHFRNRITMERIEKRFRTAFAEVEQLFEPGKTNAQAFPSSRNALLENIAIICERNNLHGLYKNAICKYADSLYTVELEAIQNPASPQLPNMRETLAEMKADDITTARRFEIYKLPQKLPKRITRADHSRQTPSR